MSKINGTNAPAGVPNSAPAPDPTDLSPPAPPAATWTPTPFKADMGPVWLATALGGGVGTLGGMAMMGYGGTSPSLGVLIGAAAVLGVIGAGIGHGISYASQSGAHEAEQKRQADAHIGTPLSSVASELIKPFDHSRNGSIELVNTTRLESRDENVRIEQRMKKDGAWSYDIWDDDWDYKTNETPEVRGFSAVEIWRSADANNDQVVAQAELEALLATFDANSDSQIQTAEREAFDAAHPILGEEWHPA